jgi:hypothetical protein
MKQLVLPQLEVPQITEEQLPWHSRAKLLIENNGFQPTTISEINTAFSGVIAFDETPAKTGTHLQEVLLNQKTNPIVESPDRAVRAIVWGMGLYFNDSADRRDGIRSVYDVLQDDVNPNLNIMLIEDLNALGVLSTIQHYAVRKAIATADRKPLQGGIKQVDGKRRLVTNFDVSDDNILNEVMIEMLLKTLPETSLKVGEFSALALDAGKSQKTRRDFWRSALNKTRSHLAARPVADKILSSRTAAGKLK